jgi:hypothetical protein
MNITNTARLGALAIGALVVLSGCSTPYEWEPYPEQTALERLTAEQWRQDVEYLRTELPERNPHFREDTGMASAFDEQAQALLASIDETTSASEMIAGLSHVLALVGEGHTGLNTYPTTYFPLIAGWFSDGFYVAGADAEYEDLVGARIVGIDDASGTDVALSQLEPMLNSVISVDHGNGYRAAHGSVLVDPYLTRGLGLADATGITYRLDNGTGVFEATIAEKPADELSIVRASDDAPNTPLAARSSDPNWYTRADDSTIYLSYDDCSTDAMPLLQGVVNELKRSTVDRLIVDLRDNSGGASAPGTWFASQVSGIPGINRDGGIFVLIGPDTFSSAMMLAVDFMDKTDALFAGKPLAESPNSWGEVKRFPLPNSGLMVGHSTRFFEYGRGKELRLDEDGNLVPDDGLRIERSFSDYANGVDPVAEEVLAYGR